MLVMIIGKLCNLVKSLFAKGRNPFYLAKVVHKCQYNHNFLHRLFFVSLGVPASSSRLEPILRDALDTPWSAAELESQPQQNQKKR